MDQSALLSVVNGMYDRLVQDVSNRVYGMMLETELVGIVCQGAAA